jgi:hypothetical protein
LSRDSLDLLEIVEAGNAFGLLLRAIQRGQEHCGQNGDDGDDYEQLDQRECAGRLEESAARTILSSVPRHA